MTTKNNTDSGGGCLFWVIVIIVGLFLGGRNLIRYFDLKSFNDHLNEYTAFSDLQPLNGNQYLTGKVITIDTKTEKIDHIYYDIPVSLRATTPEEAGTVIWFECDDQTVGAYSDGATAYQIICQITAVDKKRATVIASKRFRGSSPPSNKSGGGSRTGSHPKKAMVAYITTLPRQ